MGVKWTTKKNQFPKMERAAMELDGRRVNVGVFGEQAWLAGIHEYGCKIQVTDKMRAYLHGQGLHLKATTGYITIPERAFLRNGYDRERDGVVDCAEAIMCDVMSGHMPVNMFLETIGDFLKENIQNYAAALDSPPNHPFTKKQKGGSNPLVDTGDMIGSITYEVQ